MKRFYLIGFTLLMLFDTLAQVSFKFGGDGALPVSVSFAWLGRLFSNPWIYGAVVGYIGSFFTWMTLLKHAPIGPAFAASHLEVVSVMVISVPIFGDHLGTLQILGAMIILGGIGCLALDEGHAEKP